MTQGKFSSGVRAPDRKKKGKMMKFMMMPKPCMSFIREAKMRPIPMNVKAISSMNMKAKPSAPAPGTRNPRKSEAPKISKP